MDLIVRSQAGDPEAFAGLFHQYKNLVFKTAFLLLGEAELAEDALQEVFLKTHRALHQYNPTRAAFTTWLYRITVNHCLNQRRKRGVYEQALPDEEYQGQPGIPSLEDQYERDEPLYQALDRLGDKSRAVIVLRYHGNLSYDEIAQVLEIPLGTVKSRLSQALASLRRELTTIEAEQLPSGEKKP